jgi:hypothetical protein
MEVSPCMRLAIKMQRTMLFDLIYVRDGHTAAMELDRTFDQILSGGMTFEDAKDACKHVLDLEDWIPYTELE